MSFEIISTIYPPAHEIQDVQPSYFAEDLGMPITIGNKLNFPINFNQSRVNLIAPLPFNLETLSEKNLLAPSINVKFSKIEPNRQIDRESSEFGILNSELRYKSLPSGVLNAEVYDSYKRTWKKEFGKGTSLLANKFNSELKGLSDEETSSVYTPRGTKNSRGCGRHCLPTFIRPVERERGDFNLVSLNPTHSSINLVEPLQFNLETLSEEDSPNSQISVKLKEIESKLGRIESVSTDIKVGAADIKVGAVDIKVGAVKSELDLDSQDLETELTLLSESGFKFKMKKELQNSDRELTIRPVVSFKKSFDLFPEQSETEPKDKKISSSQTNRLAVLRRLTQDSTYSNSLIIDRENEIDDSSKDIKDLTKSLNSLATSELTTNSTFSLKGDLEDFSAELEFPVPGILIDELELKIKTNVPEVLLDGEDLQDNIKSTLSLRYGIAIDDAAELEIESSYNLRTSQTTHQIVFELL